MNSFINWMGGKRSLKDEIIPRFPEEYERYIEVFGGGGSILFAKRQSKFEVYNDFNNNLTNLFMVVKEKPMAFLKELGFLPFHSRYGFEDLLNHLNHDTAWVPDQFAEQTSRVYGEEYYKEEIELCDKYLTAPQLEEVKLIYQTRCENIYVKRAVIFYKVIMHNYGSGGKSVSCQPYSIRKTFQDVVVGFQVCL